MSPSSGVESVSSSEIEVSESAVSESDVSPFSPESAVSDMSVLAESEPSSKLEPGFAEFQFAISSSVRSGLSQDIKNRKDKQKQIVN